MRHERPQALYVLCGRPGPSEQREYAAKFPQPRFRKVILTLEAIYGIQKKRSCVISEGG